MAYFTGGCLCGAVRYEINGDPVRVAHCHCDDCRKATGSSFATNAFFKEDDLVVLKGTTKTYMHTADSGNSMNKEFCPAARASRQSRSAPLMTPARSNPRSRSLSRKLCRSPATQSLLRNSRRAGRAKALECQSAQA